MWSCNKTLIKNILSYVIVQLSFALSLFDKYVCFKKMQLKFDWKKGHKTNPEEYEKEPIIFFEYTGKQSEYLSDEDFISNDKYKGKDYDDTEKMRDKVMKK